MQLLGVKEEEENCEVIGQMPRQCLFSIQIDYFASVLWVIQYEENGLEREEHGMSVYWSNVICKNHTFIWTLYQKR